MHDQDVLPVAAVAVVPHGRDVVRPRRRQLACTIMSLPSCRYICLRSQFISRCATPHSVAAVERDRMHHQH